MDTITLNEKELSKLRSYLSQEGEDYLQSVLNKREAKRLAKEKKKLKKVVNKVQVGTKEERAKKFREDLVKKQTTAEKKFKAILKSLDIKYEFQRIFYIKNSFRIVDFYLPEQNVIIEIDGEYHNNTEQLRKDMARSYQLEEEGVNKVIRFTNKEVANNVECREKLKKLFK